MDGWCKFYGKTNKQEVLCQYWFRFFLFRIIKNVSECFVIHLLTSENDERIFLCWYCFNIAFLQKYFYCFHKIFENRFFFCKIKFLLLFRMIIESCFFVETKTRCFLCYDNYSYSIWELIDYQINYEIKSFLCFKFMI